MGYGKNVGRIVPYRMAFRPTNANYNANAETNPVLSGAFATAWLMAKNNKKKYGVLIY